MQKKRLTKPNIPSKVFKSAKDGQKSFRITKSLLDTIYNKSVKLSKKTELIITVPCGDKHTYVLTCSVKKLEQFKGV